MRGDQRFIVVCILCDTNWYMALVVLYYAVDCYKTASRKFSSCCKPSTSTTERLTLLQQSYISRERPGGMYRDTILSLYMCEYACQDRLHPRLDQFFKCLILEYQVDFCPCRYRLSLDWAVLGPIKQNGRFHKAILSVGTLRLLGYNTTPE